MIKKLRVAVDHGNRNMKTCHFIFTTGQPEQDKKPARGEKYLKYQGSMTPCNRSSGLRTWECGLWFWNCRLRLWIYL